MFANNESVIFFKGSVNQSSLMRCGGEHSNWSVSTQGHDTDRMADWYPHRFQLPQFSDGSEKEENIRQIAAHYDNCNRKPRQNPHHKDFLQTQQILCASNSGILGV